MWPFRGRAPVREVEGERKGPKGFPTLTRRARAKEPAIASIDYDRVAAAPAGKGHECKTGHTAAFVFATVGPLGVAALPQPGTKC